MSLTIVLPCFCEYLSTIRPRRLPDSCLFALISRVRELIRTRPPEENFLIVAL